MNLTVRFLLLDGEVVEIAAIANNQQSNANTTGTKISKKKTENILKITKEKSV